MLKSSADISSKCEGNLVDLRYLGEIWGEDKSNTASPTARSLKTGCEGQLIGGFVHEVFQILGNYLHLEYNEVKNPRNY